MEMLLALRAAAYDSSSAGGILSPTKPDSGYGLLFLPCLFLTWRRGRSPSDEDLKLASFLTHVEKGRRR
jgi:hypothetical protein